MQGIRRKVNYKIVDGRQEGRAVPLPAGDAPTNQHLAVAPSRVDSAPVCRCAHFIAFSRRSLNRGIYSIVIVN